LRKGEGLDKIFNNREVATAIWLFVIFFFMLIKKDIRKSLLKILKIFFGLQILSLLFLMIFYFVLIITFLYFIKFWNISLLKDSIIWFCFAGIVTVFNAATSPENEKIFRKIIIYNLNLIIILEFIINTYTFSLLKELIFIPSVTLIVVLGVFAETKSKYSSVEKTMNKLQIFIGISILILSIFNIFTDFKNFGNLATLKSFLLPPIFSVSFLPFIYLVVLFLKYELLFSKLNLGQEKSKKLKIYAKRKIFKCCFLSLNKTSKALNMYICNLTNIKSIEDVDEMEIIYKKQL